MIEKLDLMRLSAMNVMSRAYPFGFSVEMLTNSLAFSSNEEATTYITACGYFVENNRLKRQP
jgi:hypothetical protein